MWGRPTDVELESMGRCGAQMWGRDPQMWGGELWGVMWGWDPQMWGWDLWGDVGHRCGAGAHRCEAGICGGM